MDTTQSAPSPTGVIERLAAATSRHDLEAVVACFAPDYTNETPAHPARGFTGSAQVRSNWSQIFAAVPDLRGDLVATAESGPRVWAEWDMHGTRQDGQPHHLRGVVIFTVTEGLISSARFYLEPVDRSRLDVDGAVRVGLGGES
jgi:ketosteroid isomerase-like protein